MSFAIADPFARFAAIVLPSAWRYLGETLAAENQTRIQLCGRLVACIEGRRLEDSLPGRQGRSLFAYLVANRFRPASRDELIGALWPGEQPVAADNALSALLSKLRRCLGPDVLDGRADVQLRLPGGAWVDVEVAREQLHRAESAVSRSDWTAGWAPARATLHIAARGFLPGLEGEWIEVRRRELHELRVRALECVAAVGLGLGGNEIASTERSARLLVDLEPFRESGHRLLMETLARRGNVAESLRVYENLRVFLREELGAAPGPETQALHRRLLEPVADAAPTTRAFMFTDICGSTDLVEAIGDKAWYDLVAWHDRTLRGIFADHDGEEVDHAGDGFFVAFPDPRTALECAVAVQSSLAEHRRAHGFAPQVRIGVHAASAVRRDGGYRGKGVHVAARVAALAGPGEIVASRASADGSASGLRCSEPRTVSLKGIAEPLEVVTVGSAADATGADRGATSTA
jgi:class 3 adenylate cyclase